MHAIGHPGFNHPQPLERPQLESQIGRGMRLVGRAGPHITLGAVKQQCGEVHEIAAGDGAIVNIHLRLAVQELAVKVQPGERVGSEQHLTVDAASADSVSLLEAVEAERLAQYRDGAVAGIRSGVVGRIVVLESGAALLQGDVEEFELEPHAAPVVVRAVPHGGGHGEFVVGVQNPGIDPVAASGVVVVAQVRADMAVRKQVQIHGGRAAADVERLLVEAGGREGVGERRHGVEVRRVSIVRGEVVDALLADVQVGAVIELAAPAVCPRVQAVEKPPLGILDGEIEAGQFGPLPLVHDAAIFLEVAPGSRHKAETQVDAAGEPLPAGGRGRGLGCWGRGRGRRRRRRLGRRRLIGLGLLWLLGERRDHQE